MPQPEGTILTPCFLADPNTAMVSPIQIITMTSSILFPLILILFLNYYTVLG